MIRLAERNMKERAAIVDFTLMPTAQCDLNFRPPGSSFARQFLSLDLLTMGLHCALAAGLLWAVRPLTTLYSPTLVICVSMVGVLLTVRRRYLATGRESDVLRHALIAILVIPLVTCLGMVALNLPGRKLVVGVLVLIVLPWLLWTADRITQHAVWWSTANPCVSHRMMSLGRLLWRDRFAGRVRLGDHKLSGEETTALNSLRSGIGFCVRATLVVLSMVVAAGMAFRQHPADVARSFLLLTLVFQLPMCVWNTLLYPGAASRFLVMVKHWCCWDVETALPPTVFFSPCGTVQQRRFQIMLLVTGMSFVLVGMWCLPLRNTVSVAGMVLNCLFRLAIPLLTLPFFILLLLFNIIGPVLAVYCRLFEQKPSPLVDDQWTAFDGYSDRLQHSCNPVERRCLYRGYHPETIVPILIDQKLNFEHQLIIGATGIGKTALGLIGYVSQLIRRGESAVVINDCKGDRALFHTARLEAERRGATFKWFTNRPLHSTYVFNPYDQRPLQRLTMQQIVGLFMMSLNLHHGDDYGRAWFSIASRSLFQEALKQMRQRHLHSRPYSFAEVLKVLRQIATSETEFKAAQHLAFVVDNLSQYEQLNLSPTHDPLHPAVVNAIHMPEVLSEKQVIYFSLVGATDISTVGEIARLAMYSAISAAVDHRDRTGRRAALHLINDEAQITVAKNIENLMAQAREFGTAITLSLQTMSQLNPPGGTDLRELVQNCTTIKQIFSARDPDTQEYISKISGDVGYYGASWQQFLSRIEEGDVRMQRAVYRPLRESEPYIDITQEIGPRLTAEDIADIGRHPNRCIMNVGRTSGYSSYLGAFPVHVDFTMPEVEYERRNNDLPWPDGRDGTIEIPAFWPDANEHTIVPTSHPPLLLPDQTLDVDQLEEIKRRLNERF